MKLQEPLLDMAGFVLIGQGAEAKLLQGQLLGEEVVVKQRFNKAYRHPALDEKLTVQRLKTEIRCLSKARRLGVPAPTVLLADLPAGLLVMALVEGPSLKAAIKQELCSQEELRAAIRTVGRYVAALHDGGLVHGDLTTSNIILHPQQGPVLIDFGLSSMSSLAEDKAVDLYVLERACISAHTQGEDLFAAFRAAYREHSRLWHPTLKRFEEVRLRGRKRCMVG